MRRTTVILITAAMAVSLSGCAEWIVDAELEKLCKSEGGIKVFEKVEMDASQFRPDGYPIFFRDKAWGVSEENSLKPDYKSEHRLEILRKVLWVKLQKNVTLIRRVEDQKVLGHVTVFARLGGGVPLSEGAGNICPGTGASFGNLIKSIFIHAKLEAGK